MLIWLCLCGGNVLLLGTMKCRTTIVMVSLAVVEADVTAERKEEMREQRRKEKEKKEIVEKIMNY